MRNATLLLALAGLALSGAPVAAQGGRGLGEHAAVWNGWVFNLEAGKQRARQEGKPLMVVLRCLP